jgi:hypothetical protein
VLLLGSQGSPVRFGINRLVTTIHRDIAVIQNVLLYFVQYPTTIESRWEYVTMMTVEFIDNSIS